MTGEPWARVGEQVLEWDSEAVGRIGAPLLVTQVGRSFQAARMAACIDDVRSALVQQAPAGAPV